MPVSRSASSSTTPTRPASLEKVLEILAPVAAARGGGLIAVFGSAGERDTAKRSVMGRIAGERCRLVVVTDEDPRSEDADEINDEIARGAEAAGKRRGSDLLVIPDRRAAIAAAFERARKGDVVLLAGKGHERSIIYADGPKPWDERTVALEELAALGYGQPLRCAGCLFVAAARRRGRDRQCAHRRSDGRRRRCDGRPLAGRVLRRGDLRRRRARIRPSSSCSSHADEIEDHLEGRDLPRRPGGPGRRDARRESTSARGRPNGSTAGSRGRARSFARARPISQAIRRIDVEGRTPTAVDAGDAPGCRGRAPGDRCDRGERSGPASERGLARGTRPAHVRRAAACPSADACRSTRRAGSCSIPTSRSCLGPTSSARIHARRSASPTSRSATPASSSLRDARSRLTARAVGCVR